MLRFEFFAFLAAFSASGSPLINFSAPIFFPLVGQPDFFLKTLFHTLHEENTTIILAATVKNRKAFIEILISDLTEISYGNCLWQLATIFKIIPCCWKTRYKDLLFKNWSRLGVLRLRNWVNSVNTYKNSGHTFLKVQPSTFLNQSA